MANAIKSTDVVTHVARRDEARKKREQKRQCKAICASLAVKKFSELTGNDKDDLLKAIALELGLIAPD